MFQEKRFRTIMTPEDLPVFTHFLDLNSNSKNDKITKSQIITCPICHKTFARRWNLKKHLKLHNLDDSEIEKLQNELKSKRSPPKILPKAKLKCSDCGKVFNCNDKLTIHMKIHLGWFSFCLLFL